MDIINDKRRKDAEHLGRVTSFVAAVAPDKIPGKQVRECDRKEMEGQKKDIEEKWPSLFDFMGGLSEPEKKHKYSYTTDLYDATPKFRPRINKRIQNKYLDPIKQNFSHCGNLYTMELSPSQIDGTFYFPGQREQFVEMELAQLAFEKGMPIFGVNWGVKFSIYELRERLKKNKHTFSYRELKEALCILARTNMSISSADGNAVMEENLLKALCLRTWDDWKELGRGSECYVEFNSLHVAALKNSKWKLLDHKKATNIEPFLARWIYLRMSREWSGAQNFKSITWLLSNIVMDSGININRLRDAKREIESALDYLKSHNMEIQKWVAEPILGGQRSTKLVNVKYYITPGITFVSEMKRRNQLKRDASEKIEEFNSLAEKNHVKKLPFS